jgi:hypothetical protein
MDAVRDSGARAWPAPMRWWVRVDSVARLLPDSAAGDRADVRGSLSAGLVAAVQAAHAWPERLHASRWW